MSLVIPPGFGSAAFVLTGNVGTQPYVTTLGVDLSDAGGDFVGAADILFTCYATNFMPLTSNALTLDRVTLSVGQDGPGGSVDSTLAPVNGTVTSTQFGPTAMSAIARKTTNVLGRPGRGRMFMPGVLRESEVDPDGTVTTAARATLNTALGNFYDDLTDDTGGAALPPVLLHSSTLLGPPTPIVGFTVSDLVGWIRGRIR